MDLYLHRPYKRCRETPSLLSKVLFLLPILFLSKSILLSLAYRNSFNLTLFGFNRTNSYHFLDVDSVSTSSTIVGFILKLLLPETVVLSVDFVNSYIAWDFSLEQGKLNMDIGFSMEYVNGSGERTLQ